MPRRTHKLPEGTTTPWFTFVGMNIRGTPPMKAESVEHDLLLAREKADVLVVQEFRWPWYWRVAKKVMGSKDADGTRWCSSPGFKTGRLAPVLGAQPVMWDSSQFKRVRVFRSLLHKGYAKISESRFLRGVTLRHRDVPLAFVAGTTHPVVKGDERTDTPLRRQIMATDLAAFDRFLGRITRRGHAVVFQLDANIRPGTEAFAEFERILRKHGATLHGVHGIEYLLTIDGVDVAVEVKRSWVIPVRNLKTDHEGRGITLRLVARPGGTK